MIARNLYFHFGKEKIDTLNLDMLEEFLGMDRMDQIKIIFQAIVKDPSITKYQYEKNKDLIDKNKSPKEIVNRNSRHVHNESYWAGVVSGYGTHKCGDTFTCNLCKKNFNQNNFRTE